MLKSKVEGHTPPQILQAREATAKALAEAEHGWERAQAVIAQRAELRQSLSVGRRGCIGKA
jgi:hypothetical protein